MRPIEAKQFKYGLTPAAGPALVGDHLKALAPCRDTQLPDVSVSIAHGAHAPGQPRSGTTAASVQAGRRPRTGCVDGIR